MEKKYCCDLSALFCHSANAFEEGGVGGAGTWFSFLPIPSFWFSLSCSFPSSQPLPPRLALNLFWSPRFRLETRLPGVQVTSQFKHCQSSCFHFLLSSPHLNCLSACLSLSLSLSDFLPTPLPALVMRLIRWRVFCWSLSLSVLMFICVTTVCVFTSI